MTRSTRKIKTEAFILRRCAAVIGATPWVLLGWQKWRELSKEHNDSFDARCQAVRLRLLELADKIEADHGV